MHLIDVTTVASKIRVGNLWQDHLSIKGKLQLDAGRDPHRACLAWLKQSMQHAEMHVLPCAACHGNPSSLLLQAAGVMSGMPCQARFRYEA